MFIFQCSQHRYNTRPHKGRWGTVETETEQLRVQARGVIFAIKLCFLPFFPLFSILCRQLTFCSKCKLADHGYNGWKQNDSFGCCCWWWFPSSSSSSLRSSRTSRRRVIPSHWRKWYYRKKEQREGKSSHSAGRPSFSLSFISSGNYILHQTANEGVGGYHEGAELP